MWDLKDLINHANENHTLVNNNWVPVKPLNSEKKYQSLIQRFKNAWNVFHCKADCFRWPEKQ